MQLNLQVDLVPQNHRRQLIVVTRLIRILLPDETCLLLYTLSVRLG